MTAPRGHSCTGPLEAKHMFDISLRSADHVRRYAIVTRSTGWEVRVEEDRRHHAG